MDQRHMPTFMALRGASEGQLDAGVTYSWMEW